MQQGRLEVVHVNLVFGDVISDLVGRSNRLPRLESAAGEPHGESINVVIPPQELLAIFTLWGSAKLTAPNDNRLVQQSALFEIRDQRRTTSIRLVATFL